MSYQLASPTKITTLIADAKTFTIVRDFAGRYWALESADIDATGKLTRDYNGLTGCMSGSLQETINLARIRARADRYAQEGRDAAQGALQAVLDIYGQL